MKTRMLLIVCCLLLGVACAKKPLVASTPLDPCPMPAGYQMGPAVEMAEKTLNTCPGKLDQVFIALIDIGKHSPDKENATLIQEMLKRLIKENKISETYTKVLYQKYFSPNFVTIPDMKVYNLAGEVTAIKRTLKEELACKRIGLVESCNDKESYKHAEGQYVRAVGFIENLAYNDEYLKTQR
ncbi:MAG: hypothetical protein U9N82_13260 [Thermodesulfobacteriota bacterium]|nr:hypothetical protein [Thermodesulfobacteriota bacterium]